MKAPELPALTGVRFFAASMVFVNHITNLIGPNRFLSKYSLASLGVSLFFVLSGFILTYNYTPLLVKGVNLGNYSRFLWDRLAKIYPLYLLTLLLAIPIELAGHHREWSWGALALQFFLLQCILPVGQLGATDHFNVPGWSISCEMFFYLLAPFLIWIGFATRRLATVVVLGWLTAIVVAVAAGAWALHISPWPARFAPARSAEFIAGVVTAVCYLKGRMPSKMDIQLCIWVGFFLMALPIFVGSQFLILDLGFLGAPGSALFIYGLAHGQGWLAQFLSHRWLLLLGMSSFAFYLIHDLIIRVFKGIFAYCHVSNITTLTATTVAVILFVLIQILSVYVLKTFELPIQKYLRGLTRKRNPV